MNLRDRTRRAALAVAGKLRLLDLLNHRLSGGLTVLTYHRVLPDDECAGYPLRSLVVPTSEFRHQIEWLSKHCVLLPLGRAMNVIKKRGTQPVVSVTFDDGYADNFEAAGVLEDHGCLATFFVTSGLIGTNRLLWFDQAASCWCAGGKEAWAIAKVALGSIGDRAACPADVADWMSFLKRLAAGMRTRVIHALETQLGTPGPTKYSMLRADQVLALHRRGHEIGSHSVTHPLLPQLSDTELRDEVIRSRAQVSQVIGAEVAGFSYPNGDCDDRVVTAVRSAGYSYACTTRAGINRISQNPMRLRRIHISARNRDAVDPQYNRLAFRAKLCGL